MRTQRSLMLPRQRQLLQWVIRAQRSPQCSKRPPLLSGISWKSTETTQKAASSIEPGSGASGADGLQSKRIATPCNSGFAKGRQDSDQGVSRFRLRGDLMIDRVFETVKDNTYTVTIDDADISVYVMFQKKVNSDRELDLDISGWKHGEIKYRVNNGTKYTLKSSDYPSHLKKATRSHSTLTLTATTTRSPRATAMRHHRRQARHGLPRHPRV